jgi:hypothetical protein
LGAGSVLSIQHLQEHWILERNRHLAELEIDLLSSVVFPKGFTDPLGQGLKLEGTEYRVFINTHPRQVPYGVVGSMRNWVEVLFVRYDEIESCIRFLASMSPEGFRLFLIFFFRAGGFDFDSLSVTSFCSFDVGYSVLFANWVGLLIVGYIRSNVPTLAPKLIRDFLYFSVMGILT